MREAEAPEQSRRAFPGNPTFPTPPFERGIGNTIRPIQWELEVPRLHMWNASVSDRCRPASSRPWPNGTTVAFPEFDPDYNKGPADWDARHNWVLNVVWDLPFARGKTGVAGALLDGWQLSGISTMRSGQPLTVFVQNNWSRSQWSPSIAPTTGLDRPDLAPGYTADRAVLRQPDRWFDPAAFVLQPQGTLGNSRRGGFRGPNLRTLDVAAVKRLPLGGAARHLC